MWSFLAYRKRDGNEREGLVCLYRHTFLKNRSGLVILDRVYRSENLHRSSRENSSRRNAVRNPTPGGLSFTHILQWDFVKQPLGLLDIVDCFTNTSIGIGFSSLSKKMWVRIRPGRAGACRGETFYKLT